MKRQSSPIIVLRRWPYSESSLAIRVLTPAHGTLSMLAKGAYKPKSGMMGVLDTWVLAEVEFGSPEGAEMQSLYQARLIDRMSGISLQPDRLAAAGVLAELAELAAPPGQESTSTFLFLLHQLQALAGKQALAPLMCGALLQVLDLLGLSPRLLPDLPSDDMLWFDFENGGVLEADSKRPSGHAILTSKAALNLLQSFREDPKATIRAKDEEFEEALTILGQFLHFHLERPPRAWNALRKYSQPLNRQ